MPACCVSTRPSWYAQAAWESVCPPMRTLVSARRRFRFRLAGSAKDVGMATGATIHTANGLKVTVQRRQLPAPQAEPQQAAAVAS